MYDKSQMMRGTLEGCILKIISVETTYGYEIVTKLQDFGFEDMKEGTIYPILVRLEKKNMISSQFRPSPLGPSRKYYSLTREGQEQLNILIHNITPTEKLYQMKQYPKMPIIYLT